MCTPNVFGRYRNAWNFSIITLFVEASVWRGHCPRRTVRSRGARWPDGAPRVRDDAALALLALLRDRNKFTSHHSAVNQSRVWAHMHRTCTLVLSLLRSRSQSHIPSCCPLRELEPSPTVAINPPSRHPPKNRLRNSDNAESLSTQTQLRSVNFTPA